MHSFLLATIGGMILGSSVVGYLYIHGRIAGISGLLAQAINPKTVFSTPAIWFLAGLIFMPFVYRTFTTPQIDLQASPPMLMVAGLLVGFGTRLGSGCTSGHGICGISRLSPRSMVATASFMLAGFVTVYIIRHLLRWQS